MSSLAARPMVKRLPRILDMHLFYFSRANLEAMTQSAALQRIESSTYHHNFAVCYLFKKLAHFSPPGICRLVSMIALLVCGKIIATFSLVYVRLLPIRRKQAVASAAEQAPQ